MSAVSPERDRVIAFARAALAKRLVSKEHAEECVKIARDAARRLKPIPVEDVFVRKGYLRRPEAQAILRGLGKLELAPNIGATPERGKPRRRCPNCDKDPGHLPGECERCGTDLETGGPGPNATICTTCSRVVKKGSAVCPRCATPLSRDHHRKFGHKTVGAAGAWLDRIVLLGALALGAYFLGFHGRSNAPATDEPAVADPAKEAEDALARGDTAAAEHALEAAAQVPGHSTDVDVAFALECRRAGKLPAARAAIARARTIRPEDAALTVLAAELALDANDLDGASKLLDLVKEASQSDPYFHVKARLALAQNDESAALAALSKIKARTPDEGRRLAAAALARADAATTSEDLERALHECESAVTFAPDWPAAHERLGVVLLRRQKPELARQTFERALELAPGSTPAKLGLALAADQLGDKAVAVARYKEFVDAASSDPKLEAEVARVNKRLAVLDQGK